MTSSLESCFITTYAGRLSAAMHRPENDPVAVVICCHGMLSSKDSPKYTALGDMLASRGMAVVRFDHAGCGESVRTGGRFSLSGRVRELQEVIRWVRSLPEFSRIPLGLMGSSMGGMEVLIAGGRDPRIRAVVSWAAPSNMLKGFKPSRIFRMAVKVPALFVDSLRHDFLKDMRKTSRVLVIHGARDELVPVFHARRIFETVSEPKALEIIPEGDHRMIRPEHRQRAHEWTTEWLCRYLLSS